MREYVGWLRQVLIAPRLSLTDSLARTYRRSGWSAFWRAELGLAREEILHPGSVWRPFYGQYCGPYYMARRYARLGDHEHALIALEEAYRLRRHLMVFVQVEPLFIPLRRDARFVQLTRQIHLPQTAAVAR